MKELEYSYVTNIEGITFIIVAPSIHNLLKDMKDIVSCSAVEKTLSDLIEKNNIHPELCNICGGLIVADFIPEVNEELFSNQLCYSCNFWMKKVGQDYLIIDNHLYKDGGRFVGEIHPDKLNLCGFGGRKFVIEKDNGEVIKTNNLWHIGRVPKRFEGLFKNNAKFL